MAEPKEELLYIGVYRPLEIRRSLLEASKSSIQILQANEEFKKIRQHKHELEEEFAQIIKQIIALASQIKSLAPKVKMSSLPKKPIYEPEEVPDVEMLPKEKAVPEETMEEDKLEKELKEIEEKLRGL